MPTIAEQQFIARQYNYNRVPNPLVEGLVFASVRGMNDAELADRIDQLKAENEAVEELEYN